MSTNATHFLPTPDSAFPTLLPSLPIAFRVGTRADIPFIDALQKQYRKELGFFPRAQLEGYIENGWVLVAEGVRSAEGGVQREESFFLRTPDSALRTPLGYVASRDRYLKRDELGVIYQLCVAPGSQRGLIGASLIKEVFERSAYGCKLYCCWCAQDLAANRFWESLGFVPIAFRSGSAKKPRTHIFWQKRIRAKDDVTPWWYPSETGGGAIRENRLVLPIPPGLRWDDPMPVLMPTEEPAKAKALISPKSRTRVEEVPAKREPLKPMTLARPRFGIAPMPVAAQAVTETIPATKASRAKKCPRKNDPALVRRARELRDRYLEHVNAEPAVALCGKYDVSRTLPALGAVEETRAFEEGAMVLPDAPRRLLPAA